MQEEKLVQAIVSGRFTITKVEMTVGEILKENEQKKEKVMGGGRQREQVQIKKGYYAEGSFIMCFYVLFR